jgi:glucose/arabinose dehydrogenase
MRRSHAALLLTVAALVALITVGCWYRGYLAGVLPSAAAEAGDIDLPPGFRIAVYASAVPNARQMAVGPPGVVFVGSRSEGKVYAVVDRDGDQRADQVHVLASGLNQPSGLAFRDGALYVAEVNRILRFREVARDLARPPKADVVTDAYPSDGHHGWKFIVRPDGRLYIPVGAPCNVCLPGPCTPPSPSRRPEVSGGGGARVQQWASASTQTGDSGSRTTAGTGSATISPRTS